MTPQKQTWLTHYGGIVGALIGGVIAVGITLYNSSNTDKKEILNEIKEIKCTINDMKTEVIAPMKTDLAVTITRVDNLEKSKKRRSNELSYAGGSSDK